MICLYLISFLTIEEQNMTALLYFYRLVNSVFSFQLSALYDILEAYWLIECVQWPTTHDFHALMASFLLINCFGNLKELF